MGVAAGVTAAGVASGGASAGPEHAVHPRARTPATEHRMTDDPYRDPVLYDLEYRGQQDDVTWYVALARRIGGPVLELGCGNGRITVPMARAGLTVDGVDLSAEMLADLARKLDGEAAPVRERVRTTLADFRAFQPERRYGLVIWPFNALHHCASHADLLAVLGRAHAALGPGGTLAVDLYLPDVTLYDRDPDARFEERWFAHPVTGEALYSWEQHAWDAKNRVHHVTYVWRFADGTERPFKLSLNMYEMTELRTLFARAGFRVRWEAQDFQGEPLRPRSLKWVVELERR